MDPEDIMLSEVSDRERQILYDITYIWNLKKPNFKKEWNGGYEGGESLGNRGDVV